MKASDIPGKIQLPFAASAGGSFIRTVPVPSQIGVTPGAASYTDGFPPLNFEEIALGGFPPSGQDFNGVLNAISALSRWFAGGAPVPFDPTFSTAIGGYPKGAIVQSVTAFGTIWVCTIDDNPSDPDAGGANWITLLAFIGGLTSTQIIALIAANLPEVGLVGVGINQTWQNFTGLRAQATPYTNATGSPIQVAITAQGNASGDILTFSVDGVPVIKSISVSSILEALSCCCVVPNGSVYRLDNTNSGLIPIGSWTELR